MHIQKNIDNILEETKRIKSRKNTIETTYSLTFICIFGSVARFCSFLIYDCHLWIICISKSHRGSDGILDSFYYKDFIVSRWSNWQIAFFLVSHISREFILFLNQQFQHSFESTNRPFFQQLSEIFIFNRQTTLFSFFSLYESLSISLHCIATHIIWFVVNS